MQVVKEPLGTKGARITSHLSLPGRFLVYMPFSAHVGVSRKIDGREERSRLRAMAKEKIPDVIFPEVLWDEKWYTPMYEDLTVYTSLIHHAALSINAASTVTLEFLMFGERPSGLTLVGIAVTCAGVAMVALRAR